MTLTLTKKQMLDSEKSMAHMRRDWEQQTARLADDVEAWIREEAERGWHTEREEKELSEEVVGGLYQVPVVTIHMPEGRLILEPIARGTVGSQGRVDLYAWPSLFRVMLLHKPRGRENSKDHPMEWVVRTESGLDWPLPWNRETFLGLAEGLLNA